MVSEYELTAMGMAAALSSLGWEVEVATGPTASDVLAHARRFQPHCALIDVCVGDGVGSWTDLIEPLVSTGAHVVMMTAERRRVALAEYLEAGAAGWIPKRASLDEVRSTLTHLVNGGRVSGRADRAALLELLRRERARAEQVRATFAPLSECEAHVLAALADGLSAEQIAKERFVALTTIRSQIRAVLRKLDVSSQLAAASLASEYRELLPERDARVRDRRRAFRDDRRAAADAAVGIA